MPDSFFWHALSSADALEKLASSLDGLRKMEVKKRLEKFGANELPKEKPKPWWSVFVAQFLNPLILVLLAAATVSALLGDKVDTGVILVAVAVNTIIGFVQELKANRALIRLQSYIQPLALVRRNGKEVELPASDLVPGDILILQTGDQVTADARLINAFDCQANEATLTGESFPVEKQLAALDQSTTLADRTNMIFAGTTIVGGRALAVVTATGSKTEIGKIATLIAVTPEQQTPLQKQLGQMARWISCIVGGIVMALFSIGILSDHGFVEMFEISVALAVAAIPEGLIVGVTVILAVGMQRILKRRALVRRLVAAETLGSVSVICSDKTGTLTEGNMRVVGVYGIDGQTAITKEILEALVLCNNATRAEGLNGSIVRGSPTERALFEFAATKGIDSDAVRGAFPIVADIPFDSSYKFRLTAHSIDGAWRHIMIGAPAKVFAACSLTPQRRKRLEQMEDQLTQKGFRLVAVAQKTVRKQVDHLDKNRLSGFHFSAFIAIQDPIRPDVADHIAAARKAGIRTVIVTGDHPKTAIAIAKEAGIVVGPDQVVIGSELDDWDDEELYRRVSRISLYARVEPRHKIRIIEAWRARGEVVAMTGDGVNDAPALKAADIGIALGSGTEVAKQSSDLVLLDNSFSTITKAIEQGRVVFDNIRKSSVYLMADSFTEIVLIAGSLFLGLPIPILPAQILWINLVADSLPNAGLTLEPGEKDVMRLPPRPRGEPVLNREMMTIIITIGIVTDLLLFALYLWLLQSIDDIAVVRSIMFAAVGIDSLIYIFAVKSFRRTIFRINPFSNLWLVGGVVIGFGLMLVALIHPFFQSIFDVVPLGLSDWLLLLIIGMIKLVAIELVKEFFLLSNKRQIVSEIN